MKSPDRDAADELERVARALYEDDHRGLKNCWSWDDSGLDDEHPGRRRRYLKQARAALVASELATLRRRVETESEHVLKYGRHSDGCPRGQPVGDGNGPWECNCGFSAALDEAMFPSPLPPGRNEG